MGVGRYKITGPHEPFRAPKRSTIKHPVLCCHHEDGGLYVTCWHEAGTQDDLYLSLDKTFTGEI